MNRLLTIVDSKYQRLEYLESTGTQYIDTGYVPTENDVIEADLQNMDTSGSGDKFFIGQQFADNTKGGLWVEQYNTSNIWYVRFGSLNSVGGVPTATEINNKIHITLKKGEFKSSGGSAFYPIYSGSMQSTPITLCGRWNDAGTTFNAWSVRFWNFRVTNNGVTKLNLVPVLRKSDNELGMLDLVEGKFYPNAGTGKFTANLDTMYAIIQGSPTVQDGRVSGFSSGSYLKTPEFSPQDKKWEMVWKFTTGNSVDTCGVVTGLGTTDSIAPLYINSQKSLMFYLSSNGTAWDIVSSATIIDTIQPNTTYIIKIEFTGIAYKAYSLENNQWVLKNSVSSSTKIYGTIPLVIGNNRGNQTGFSGSIDLNNSYIKLGSTKYKLQAVVGYTVVGSPTESPSGVFSGFSASDYLEINKPFSPMGQWEMVCCFITPETAPSNWTSILSLNNYISVQIELSNGNTPYLQIGFSENTSSYSIGFIGGSSSQKLNLNTKYWAKIRFTGTQYIVELSTDGINYTEYGNLNSTKKISSDNNKLRIGLNRTNTRGFVGSIDLNNTYIKINNKLWFNGQEA